MGWRWLGYGVVGTALALCILSCASPPAYEGPRSDHFDGERFINQGSIRHNSFSDFLRWMWEREPEPWQLVTDAVPGPRPPTRSAALRATFVNHSTLLLQVAGLNILTDPIWSERASPVSWAGPKRVRPPGIRFEALPPIDVVVVSHNHYDHMDLPTLRRLYERDRPRFVVGLGNAPLLKGEGIENVTEIDWWQALVLSPDLTLHGVPAQHFSQRTMWDRDRRLWMGVVIQSPDGAIYFAGDTGMGPHFRQIRERFGPMRLSMLPIGAYRPRWFMAPVHTSPLEAVQAHKTLESDYSVAIHYGTFRLADDAQSDPIEALALALESEQVGEGRFLLLGFGEGREFVIEEGR